MAYEQARRFLFQEVYAELASQDDERVATDRDGAC